MTEALQVIEVKIADLVHTYTKETNPNQMEPAKFTALVNLINEEGFLQPILVNKSKGKSKKLKVIDGHHRVWAAQELGLKTVTAVVKPSSVPLASLIGVGMNNLRGEPDLAAVSRVLMEAVEATQWEADQLSLLTGISESEIEALTKKQLDDDLEILEDVGKVSVDEEPEEDLNKKPYVLEISFANKETYRLARRKLRKAAGKGNDLSVGLLSLLGEDGEQDG